MKKTLTLKTTNVLIPVLIGIFVVSGTLLCLPLLKNESSFDDVGFELREVNPTEPLSAVVKPHFVLPAMTIRFKDNTFAQSKPRKPISPHTITITKEIFRNLLFARAP